MAPVFARPAVNANRDRRRGWAATASDAETVSVPTVDLSLFGWYV